jgi:hypothetical protein
VARALLTVLASLVLCLTYTQSADARGGNYKFAGTTPTQETTVRNALQASSFDWGVVPAEITIHVGDYEVSHATRGHIYLDAELLSAGRFAWAIIQDEYAHQVDFFLFTDAIRARLGQELGSRDWCYSISGLGHDEYGCERFASTLVWSFWQSRDNAYRPTSATDESAAMAPAKFRALITQILAPRA